MCLSNYPPHVKKFLSKHKNHTYVTAYKVVEVKRQVLAVGYYAHNYWGSSTYVPPEYSIDKEMRGPFYSEYKYKPGWNQSDSRARKPSLKNKRVEHGIHVYLSEPEYLGEKEKLLKVKCLVSDLIGLNDEHAVFQKIYIPQNQYKEAMES